MPSLLRQRRAIAALLLVAFAAASTGVPLPVPQLAQRASERYPCEHCHCGCGSAAVCWTNCCCHTMAERLEWAKREGVRPPEHILKLALDQGYDVRQWLPDAPLVVANCCQSPAPAAKKSCCCGGKAKPAEESGVTEQRERAPGTPAWHMATCQGVLKLWLSITVAPHVGELDPSPELPGQTVAIPRPQLAFLLAAAPPTPPPERTA